MVKISQLIISSKNNGLNVWETLLDQLQGFLVANVVVRFDDLEIRPALFEVCHWQDVLFSIEQLAAVHQFNFADLGAVFQCMFQQEIVEVV